jgi:hypothetical protein
MQKLSFLVGHWKGEARMLRGPAGMAELVQAETVEYRLHGLVLIIEGVGQLQDGSAALQALGVVSFDDSSGAYSMRAFNDGRFLETEVKLLESGKGMTWGFQLGDFKTQSILRIDERGAWTELTELTIGEQPPRKLLELAVRKV